jgi:hypothetical protein
VSFIILTRNPGTRKLLIISLEPGSDAPSEYETEDEAFTQAAHIAVCDAWGFEIVELTKL